MALSFAQDDAEEELLAKALYVDDAKDVSVPFDPNKPPATAEEYLKSVMKEAQNLDGVSIGKQDVVEKSLHVELGIGLDHVLYYQPIYYYMFNCS